MDCFPHIFDVSMCDKNLGGVGLEVGQLNKSVLRSGEDTISSCRQRSVLAFLPKNRKAYLQEPIELIGFERRTCH